MANSVKTTDSINIKDYIAKAIVLKDGLAKDAELKDKFAKFTFLFPTLEDKMVCKAIFDVMFTSEIRARKFISQMVNGINSVVPQKITDMVDVYNQASVLVNEKMKLDNRKASETGGERFTEEEKKGSLSNDDKHGRQSDPFIVMNASDPNREFVSAQIVMQKGDTVVSTISKDELKLAKIENDNLQKLKQQKAEQDAKEEARRRTQYERSLAERRNKQQYAKVAKELQRIYDSHDD